MPRISYEEVLTRYIRKYNDIDPEWVVMNPRLVDEAFSGCSTCGWGAGTVYTIMWEDNAGHHEDRLEEDFIELITELLELCNA